MGGPARGTMSEDTFLPPINDLLAAVIVIATYLLRFAYLGDPAHTAPIWLIITADFILPTMAGAYLFVLAVFIAIERYGTD